MAKEELPKYNFFRKMDALGLALTYREVTLIPGYSEVVPGIVDLTSRFSRNVPLKIPMVSAAMDTVTEADMAIAMAENGGLGVLHKNLSPRDQARQVSRVKYHLNAIIDKPKTVHQDMTVLEFRNMIDENGYDFRTFPVVDDKDAVVGIITGHDLHFCGDGCTVQEAMTKDLVSGTPDISMEDAYQTMVYLKKKVLPLIGGDGRLAGMYTLSDIKRVMAGDGQIANIDERGQLRVAAAIGVHDDAFSRLEILADRHIDVVVVDTAHGNSRAVIETVKRIKAESRYDHIDVVAGNVSEPSGAKNLADAGVDGIKIGQGPGAICTTRVVTGIGIPQITAIYGCFSVTDGSNIPLCADGGLEHSGDIPKAIGAGAHSVMMGSMLAGTDESPGDIISYQGRRWKVYRGMGSLGAMKDNRGSRERYSQGEASADKLVPEGIEGRVDYKGPVGDILFQYCGGLRAGMGYVGAKDIGQLREKGDFKRITASGEKESHPHGVVITEEAPNYSGRK